MLFCIARICNDARRPKTRFHVPHGVEPCTLRDAPAPTWDIVGPVCESGDWLGRERALAVQPGDVLALLSAGAYGMTMASNYNTRPRAAEVMLVDGQPHVIRQREEVASLFAGESLVGQAPP